MGALALTDHGNLYGAIEFYNTAKSRGIKPLVGCELYPGRELPPRKKGPQRHRRRGQDHLPPRPSSPKHLTGYQNLLKARLRRPPQGLLLQASHRPGDPREARGRPDRLHRLPRVARAAAPALRPLRRGAGGLRPASSTSSAGKTISSRIQDHGNPRAAQDHPPASSGSPRSSGSRSSAQTTSTTCARRTPARTTPCSASRPVRRSTTRSAWRFDGTQFYLKSRDEMAKLFAEVPESVLNTQLVAEMCDLTMPLPQGQRTLPEVPAAARDQDRPRRLPARPLHRRPEGALQRGLRPARPRRLTRPLRRPLAERIDFELGVITKTGFIDYFLVVWDFIAWAKQQGIPVGPGRGSGAGCLVAYVLGITNLDSRSASSSSSSASSTPSASRPPTSTSTSACAAAARSSATSARNTATTASRTSSPTAPSAPKMVIRDISRVHNLPYADADRLRR